MSGIEFSLQFFLHFDSEEANFYSIEAMPDLGQSLTSFTCLIIHKLNTSE